MYGFIQNCSINQHDYLGLIEAPPGKDPIPPQSDGKSKIAPPEAPNPNKGDPPKPDPRFVGKEWECTCRFTTDCECCKTPHSTWICGLATSQATARAPSNLQLKALYEVMRKVSEDIFSICLEMTCFQNNKVGCKPSSSLGYPGTGAGLDIDFKDVANAIKQGHCKCELVDIII